MQSFECRVCVLDCDHPESDRLASTTSVVRIGIVPPLELVTCSHVFSPQLPLNQTCKLSSPNRLCALRRFRASKTLQSVSFRGSLRQWDHLIQRQRCRELKLLALLLPS